MKRDETRHPRNSPPNRSGMYVLLPPIDSNFVIPEQSIFSCHPYPPFITVPLLVLSSQLFSDTFLAFFSFFSVSHLIHLFNLWSELSSEFFFLSWICKEMKKNCRYRIEGLKEIFIKEMLYWFFFLLFFYVPVLRKLNIVHKKLLEDYI